MTFAPNTSPRSLRGRPTLALVLVGALTSACGASGGTPARSPTASPVPTVTAAPTLSATPTSPSTSPPDGSTASTAPAPPPGPDSSEPDPSDTDGTSATATASTLFDTQRTFRLELRHEGPPHAVTGLVLDSPWYKPVEVTPRDFTLTSGPVLVPLPYGVADCRHGSPAPGADVGQVVLTTQDGQRRIPLRPHPDNLVAQRHRRECAVAAIAEVADLAFGDAWTPVAPRVVTGDLVVAMAGGASIEVRGVEGNIIFAMEAEQPLPFAVDPGSTGRLAVRASAARCDTHALIEAKRKLHFPLAVSLDGADPVIVEVEATGAAGSVFQALVESCLDETPS